MALRFVFQRLQSTTTPIRYRSSINTTVRCFSAAEQLIPGVGKGKTSTGLVGLAVDHEWQPKMVTKYQALLDKMATSDMPETYRYREIVEKVARYRIQAALDHPEDPDKVEEMCNCGQVEELVEQADDEMTVLDMILENRWWEQIKGQLDDVSIDENPHPDSVNPDDWEDAPPSDQEAPKTA
mmetsp:Transcript_21285/g.31635  ORF Transcript_21285/g.31635 Transcript_21285/m.31635 type:complete len:182 (-) Transcript_21285:240-785(-)|eukprot:CAMPEP_0194030312 /NCGR_PEP_ID=MMETSP0009_2-20130614/3854_1 /TAXON_ID=210454 /ORGANISM="Grammatophora oceanica, Strain CCMP 410" /LENGTH=181 /DNA_ID=CAMNT_0038670247 /DNA_START=47 /DNA_END=592 /DNA_ORIENTATION=+